MPEATAVPQPFATAEAANLGVLRAHMSREAASFAAAWRVRRRAQAERVSRRGLEAQLERLPRRRGDRGPHRVLVVVATLEPAALAVDGERGRPRTATASAGAVRSSAAGDPPRGRRRRRRSAHRLAVAGDQSEAEREREVVPGPDQEAVALDVRIGGARRPSPGRRAARRAARAWNSRCSARNARIASASAGRACRGRGARTAASRASRRAAPRSGSETRRSRTRGEEAEVESRAASP